MLFAFTSTSVQQPSLTWLVEIERERLRETERETEREKERERQRETKTSFHKLE